MEVMVALVVAGLVLGGAYGIVGSVADARAHTAAARAGLFPGPAARAALDGWLRSAALLEGGGPFTGVQGGTEGLRRDALSFTVDDGGVLHPGPRRIRLWVDAGGLRAEVASLRPMDGEPPDTLTLARAAAGLRAQYRAQSRDETVWLDAWRSGRALPQAVRITVLPAPQAAAEPHAGGLPWVLRMPILVPLRWNPDASDPRERSGAADAAGT